jgi:hypothetical protein
MSPIIDPRRGIYKRHAGQCVGYERGHSQFPGLSSFFFALEAFFGIAEFNVRPDELL